MTQTYLKGETLSDMLDRWIAEHDGSARDALNVALARLQASEIVADALEVASLAKQIRDEVYADTEVHASIVPAIEEW